MKHATLQEKRNVSSSISLSPPVYGLPFLDKNPIQKRENRTGMPDKLKSGIEALSGIDMSDVKVHYNSSQPAQLNARAYAQGNQIHIAPGQQKHLPHEAWHVVQQKQGRVKPTMQMKSKVNINDNAGLEKEADVMGARANEIPTHTQSVQKGDDFDIKPQTPGILQRQVWLIEADDKTREYPVLLLEGGAISFLERFGLRLNNNQLIYLNQLLEDGTHRQYDEDLNGARQLYQAILQAEQVQAQMIKQAILAASKLTDELNAIMSADSTGAHGERMVSPQAQLQMCLTHCRALTAEQTAIYLYTTYFYSPINKFLRGDAAILNSHQHLLRLIEITHSALERAFMNTPAQYLIARFRMELKPSWIGKKAVGDEMNFPGYTSTHPELVGLNGMWENIESGAFGEYEDRLALLVFEGTSRIIRPVEKYFLNEVEDIFPPGTRVKIVKKYETSWTHPGTKKKWIVDVYHLQVLPETQKPSQSEYHFSPEGFVIQVPPKMQGASAAMSQSASSQSDRDEKKQQVKQSVHVRALAYVDDMDELKNRSWNRGDEVIIADAGPGKKNVHIVWLVNHHEGEDISRSDYQLKLRGG